MKVEGGPLGPVELQSIGDDLCPFLCNGSLWIMCWGELARKLDKGRPDDIVCMNLETHEMEIFPWSRQVIPWPNAVIQRNGGSK